MVLLLFYVLYNHYAKHDAPKRETPGKKDNPTSQPGRATFPSLLSRNYSAGIPPYDPNGYIMYCPCMGEYVYNFELTQKRQ